MKNKMFQKIMATSLTAVMTAGMLAGCGGKTEEPVAGSDNTAASDSQDAGEQKQEETPADNEGGETEGGETEGGETEDGYTPLTDADGNVYDLGGMEIIVRDWYSPDEPAAPTNDFQEAQQEYHEWLQETYNFTLKQQAISDWGSAPQDFVDYATTGDDGTNYMFVLRNDTATTSAMATGLMYDLATLDCLDFSDPQFTKNKTHEMYSIGDSIYGMNSGMSEPRGGMYFNKRILEEAGVDPQSIYEMQADGTWTWDAWKEIMDKVQRDTNNDGKIDVYGTTQNNGNLVNECVWSNGGAYIDKDADGKYVYALENPETVEALEFALDLLNNYSAVYEAPEGEDAPAWDAYKEGYKAGSAAFMPDDAYNGTPGNWLSDEMEDDFGFVCFPKGPKADNYVNCWSNNIFCIPGCYDEQKAWNIAFAYKLWFGDVPGYEGDDSWKSNYYAGMRDTESVDETLPILMENGVVNYADVVPNVATGPDLVWSVAPGADLTSVIEGIRDTWKTYIEDANS